MKSTAQREIQFRTPLKGPKGEQLHRVSIAVADWRLMGPFLHVLYYGSAQAKNEATAAREDGQAITVELYEVPLSNVTAIVDRRAKVSPPSRVVKPLVSKH